MRSSRTLSSRTLGRKRVGSAVMECDEDAKNDATGRLPRCIADYTITLPKRCPVKIGPAEGELFGLVKDHELGRNPT
jgi:hypothetical protein